MRTRHRHTDPREYATELTGFERRLLTALTVVVAGDDQVPAPASPGWRRGGRAGSASWRRRLAVAAVAAVAVAATVQVVDVGPPRIRVQAGGGAPANAAELGALAARAARSAAPGLYPKPGQWVYSKTIVARDAGWRLEVRGGKVRVVEEPALAPHATEAWVQVGPKPGWAITVVTNQTGSTFAVPPLLGAANYPRLPWLPTDPDRLLQVIEQEVKRNPSKYGPSGFSTHELAFRVIAGMLGGLLPPPELQAALFEAMARIPHVTVVEDATDAAGRHGVALALAENQTRLEVILDKRTYRYLGQAAIATSDHIHIGSPGSPLVKGDLDLPTRKGQVLYRTAQLAIAFVDAPHQRPRDAATGPGAASGTGP